MVQWSRGKSARAMATVQRRHVWSQRTVTSKTSASLSGDDHGRLSAMNAALRGSLLPIATRTYCLPSNMYVIGAPVVPAGRSVSHTIAPVALLYARNLRPPAPGARDAGISGL